MKNLTKVRINEFEEMTDREMKQKVGGADASEASGTNTTSGTGVLLYSYTCPDGSKILSSTNDSETNLCTCYLSRHGGNCS